MLIGSLKLQDKEFAILPEAWSKLDGAFSLTKWLLSPMQSYPQIGRMSDVELEEFFSSSDLHESQKATVRSATNSFSGTKMNRDAAYQNIDFWHRLHRVKDAVRELQNYVASNGLFLPPPLKKMFTAMTPFLWASVVTLETAHEAKLWEMNGDARRNFEAEAEPLHSIIENAIEERLHSHAKALN